MILEDIFDGQIFKIFYLMLLGTLMLASLVLAAVAVTLFPQATWVARWRVHFSQGLYLALPFQRAVDAVAPVRAWSRPSSLAPGLKGEWS